MLHNSTSSKSLTHYAWLTPKSLLVVPLLLVLLFGSGPVRGQSRSLFDVTAQQFPAGLPKVINGAQAWGKNGGANLAFLIITGDAGSGYVTRFYKRTAPTANWVDRTKLELLNVPKVAFSTVAWGDYDGDGRDDLFMTGWTGTEAVSRLYHYGGGYFEDKTGLLPGLPGLSHGAVLWTDYDRDGKLDLLVSGFTGFGSDNGTFTQLYLNKGDQGFVKASFFPNLPQVGNSALSSADFNKDTYPDLLITGSTGNDRVSKLYLSTSTNGGYLDVTSAVTDLPGVERAALAAGDYDKDGLPDLMLTGTSGAGPVSKFYHNTKARWNDFEEVPTNIPNVKSSALDWGDYDGDGRPDLAITGQWFYTDSNGATKLIPLGALYHNTPDGFVDATIEKTNGYIPKVYNGMVAWGDADQNGTLDLVVAGDQGSGVKSYIRAFFSNSASPGSTVWPVARIMSKGSDIAPIAWLAGVELLLELLHLGFLNDAVNEYLFETSLDDPDVTAPDYPGPLAYGSAQYIDDNNLGKRSLFLTGYLYDDDFVEQAQYGTGIQLVTGDDSKQPSRKNYLKNLPRVGYSASDWADFNHDGLLDVAIIGRQGTGTLDDDYIGTAGVYLQPNAQLISLPGNPGLRNGTVDWDDYDGDGWADLLITGRDLGTDNDHNNDYHYYTFLYHNFQGQGFTDVTNLLPNIPKLAYSAAAWGDYDNDGKPDLMLTGEAQDGPVSLLYHNTGNGFEDVSGMLPNLPGLNTGTVNWVDYDHDGLLDLMVTGDSYGGPVTKLYRNKGVKSFFEAVNNALPNLSGLSNGTADWMDYDKDGRPDLLLTGDTGNGFDTKVYHNTQAGFVDASGQFANLPKVALSAAAWGDYDGDGFPDLLLTGKTEYGGPVSGLYHNMPVDVTTLLPGLPQLGNSSVAWGDYDSDGKLDLMVTGNTFSTYGVSKLYHNTGSGFEDASAKIPNLPQLAFGSVAWGDYDNDGRLDLMLTGSPSSLTGVSKLYHNTGSGFEDRSALIPDLPQLFSSAVSWADINNDGKLDLFLTGENGQSRITRLYLNTGVDFVDASGLVDNVPQVSSGSVAFGDYDHDGWVDLLLTGTAESGPVSRLYRNNVGNFTDVSSLMPGLPRLSFGAVAWGDFDADGRLDVMLTGLTGSGSISKLYHNTGSGFEDASAKLPSLPGFGSGSVSWADLNNDGHLDLLLTGTTSNGSGSRLYLGTANGFTDRSSLLVDLLENGNIKLALADYDNDGRLDLLLTGQTPSGYHSRLYHNLLAPANTPPSAPTGLNSKADPNQPWEHLIWRRASDAQTSQAGLSYNLYISEEPDNTSVVNVVGAMADYATGFRRVVRLGNAQDTSYLLTGLTPGKTYYWSVQAIDGAFAGGPFAPEQSFVAGSLDEEATFVSGFTLINATTDKAIQGLKDGDVLDLTTLPRAGLNIRANTAPKKVGSVVFELSGQQSRKHTENGAPYALFKNLQGNYFGGSLQPGDYTLTATPYGKADGKGVKGTPLTVHFRIVYPAAVTTFTLVNAVTGKDIQELKEGDVLNLSTLPTTNLSIRATTSPDMVGSVAMALSGQQTHSQVENILPYSLYGDNVKTYNPWAVETGSYTLSATPYSAPRGGGAKGAGYTIHFTVMNNAASVTMATKPGLGITGIVGEKAGASLSAAPNPLSSQSTIRFSVPTAGYAVLSLYDANGKEVRRLYQGQAEGGRQYQVSLQSQGLSAGIYTIRLTAGANTSTLKMLVARPA